MKRRYGFPALAMAGALFANAGAVAREEALVSRPGWSLHEYQVDPGMFVSPDKAAPGKLEWNPGIKPLPEVDGLKRNWDLREFLREWGVTASAATLDVVDRRLTVYASDEAHELLEQMIKVIRPPGASPLHVEVTLVEFETVAAAEIAGRSPMELRALAGGTWTIREG